MLQFGSNKINNFLPFYFYYVNIWYIKSIYIIYLQVVNYKNIIKWAHKPIHLIKDCISFLQLS
jgi:hypothetical protein